ncbi:hypothetical protein IFT84_20450 [Rhizobium sp. CFBP 8762]|uniref:hypothetical protein n=1 Tax=Rhizobium sp. CFBP 8762 TaxID=2775279 RepID=UPI001783181A|nr:hypothetical protein [Rhizobium sp. CFBP 8762]MBD8556884.1 hypothetical protein [Rhizobium sp. CFBP 8762]
MTTSTAPNMDMLVRLQNGRRLMRATGPGKVVRHGRDYPFIEGDILMLGVGGEIIGPTDSKRLVQNAFDILGAALGVYPMALVEFAAVFCACGFDLRECPQNFVRFSNGSVLSVADPDEITRDLGDPLCGASVLLVSKKGVALTDAVDFSQAVLKAITLLNQPRIVYPALQVDFAMTLLAFEIISEMNRPAQPAPAKAERAH